VLQRRTWQQDPLANPVVTKPRQTRRHPAVPLRDGVHFADATQFAAPLHNTVQ